VQHKGRRQMKSRGKAEGETALATSRGPCDADHHNFFAIIHMGVEMR